jgi:hypothetical protein
MYFSDEEYQADILHFFDLPEYQSETIMKKIETLSEQIKDIPEIREKALEAGRRIMSEDLEMCLVILFSFDYFQELKQLLIKHNVKL